MNLVYTTISPEYCPAWGIKEALRELFQEAVDVRTVYGCRSDVRYEGRLVVIEDDGPGLPLSALLMGKSGKREHAEAIGQFGEGLKLACLVLAREHRRVHISTVGYDLVPVIAYNSLFGSTVLAFDITENDRHAGTSIVVAASEEEYREAADLFLALTGGEHFYVPLECGSTRPATPEDPIFLPGGHLFVQGVAVQVPQDTDGLAFSYNIPAKQVQSRDRWAVDVWTLRSIVADLWAQCTNPALIHRLVASLGSPSTLEAAQGMVPDVYYDKLAAPEIWQAEIEQSFGRVLLAEKLPAPLIQRANELGYRLISPHYRVWQLLERFGVATAKNLEEKLSCLEVINSRSLSPMQRYVLDRVRSLARRYVFRRGDRVHVLPARLADEAAGKYTNGRIYVSPSVLDDLKQALCTVVHEYAHHVSSAQDYTSGFQRALEELVADSILARASRKAF